MKKFKLFLYCLFFFSSFSTFAQTTDLKFEYDIDVINGIVIKGESKDVTIHISNTGNFNYSGYISFNVFVTSDATNFSTDNPQITFELTDCNGNFSLAKGKDTSVVGKIKFTEPDFKADSTNIVIIWPSDNVVGGKKKMFKDADNSNNYNSSGFSIWVKTKSGGWVTGLQKDNSSPAGFGFYPNPASENLNLFFDENESGTIKICDINGKSIYSCAFITTSKNYSLPVSYIPQGVYFITIQTQKYTSSTKFLLTR